jgi:predicted GIY-YIG superfamily endonuclease
MMKEVFTVYLLHSLSFQERWYTGYTTKPIEHRLFDHNNGEVTSTRRYAPWELVTYIVFTDKEKAVAFERYLKSGSGIAFRNRHLK